MSAGYARREAQAGGKRAPVPPFHGPGYAPTVEEMAAWLGRELAGRYVVEIRHVAVPGYAALIIHAPGRPGRAWAVDQRAIGLPALEDVVVARQALAALDAQRATDVRGADRY